MKNKLLEIKLPNNLNLNSTSLYVHRSKICMLKNVGNIFRFRLEKWIAANGGTLEQDLQECPKFHNDINLFHGYAPFNTFWKMNTVFSSFSCSTTAFRNFCGSHYLLLFYSLV
jgi:hypothetical protein